MNGDEGGFASAVGGEGDSAEPTAAKQSFDRSPLKVLKGLEDKPFKQATKAIGYIETCREKEREILKACSVKALNLIAENSPEYLTAQAAQ